MGSMRAYLLAAMILGGSFIAGCCGGPGNESGCTTCLEEAPETGTTGSGCIAEPDAGADATDGATAD